MWCLQTVVERKLHVLVDGVYKSVILLQNRLATWRQALWAKKAWIMKMSSTYPLVGVEFVSVVAVAQLVLSNALNWRMNLVMSRLQTTDSTVLLDGHLTDQLLQHPVQQAHLYQDMLTFMPVQQETTSRQTGCASRTNGAGSLDTCIRASRQLLRTKIKGSLERSGEAVGWCTLSQQR